MLGQAMHHRLQDLQSLTQNREPGFIDLRVWQEATALRFCGVELHVSQGRATVGLTHLRADGQEEVLAELTCLQPGSAFSPPLDVRALAPQGGRIRVTLRTASDDAAMDLYLGSNDKPSLPKARVAVVMRVGSQAEARAAVDAFAGFYRHYAALQPGQDCHLVLDVPTPDPQLLASLEQNGSARFTLHQRSDGRIWLRRAIHALTFGDLSDLGITHVVLQPDATPLQPEGFVHALALARFMREDHVLHSGSQWDTRWPHICIDVAQILQHGLPGTSLDHYAVYLERKGLARYSFTTPPPTVPTPDLRQKVRDQIARVVVPRPAPQIARIKRDYTQQLRHLHQTHNTALRQIEERLHRNHLWDPTRTHHDQNRASRTLLSLLRNRHQGARAVIVGNGPSLQTCDLDRLTGSVTFGSNKIWLAYDVTDWRPTYYSVEDHLVLQSTREQIEALEGSLKIFPANMQDFGYHAGDTLFAPFLPPQSFEDPLSDPEFPAFSRDLSHGLAWGSTIVYSQIQIALYMGCREIVLIGVDHSYKLPEEKHGNKYIDAGERNHFHPDYRASGEIWHQPNLDVLEVSYAKARRVCEAAGARLLNASRQTALDVIERADFDQLFPPEEIPA